MALGWYFGLTSTGKALIRAVDSSSGSDDASKIIRTNSAGKIDLSFIPAGVGAPTLTIIASEALTAGQLVNIHNSGGIRVRRADASNGRAANGFVLSNFSSSESATIYGPGQEITGLTGLTIGAGYILSYTNPGGIALASSFVASNGRGYQFIGYASSATSILFAPEEYTPGVI